MLELALDEDIRLTALEPWQAAEFAEFIATYREHLGRWLPWANTITDTEGARAWLADYAEKQRTDSGRIFALRDGKTMLGGAVFRVFSAEFGFCELGVWLAPEAQGRGLITRAAIAMIDWAVTVHGIARVEWRSVSANERSIAVAGRLGMHRDGVLREAVPRDGQRLDLEVWSLLGHEWPARRAELIGRCS
ncbi:GNAT family N-acetyltransferase [Sciscionella sediminilitoris]|uniref:GNAT family N-acetyltransferase n=1 Tax=Sciscionella sediminilitoris TaxID=1445613 RepID=UPI0004DEF100|nr:GNAT family protein [Sciscionella sp. SE31]